MSVEPLTTKSTPDKVPAGNSKHFMVLTILAGIHAALSFSYFKPSSNSQLVAAIVVSAGMVYFFWRKNICAKRLVLVTAALSFLVDVPKFSSLAASGQAIIGIHLALAAFLLYRLNTTVAKAYFQP